MRDPDKTPRASGTYRIWFDMTEGLAARLEARIAALIEDGRGDDAGKARWLAAEARRLGESTINWQYLEPTQKQRAEEMDAILELQRQAEELLTA